MAWFWVVPVVVSFAAVVAMLDPWVPWILLLVPLPLLVATALVIVEFRRRRAEDRAAETPRRVKM